MSENITQKEMLNLFDAITGDIWRYGKRSPEICAAIRKLIITKYGMGGIYFDSQSGIVKCLRCGNETTYKEVENE